MIEPTLVTALQTLFPGKVFADVAPAGTTLPYCTYQQVGGTPVNYLGAEASDKKNSRIQINVWAALRSEANTKGRAVENLMVLAPLYGKIESGLIAAVDDETGYRGTRQDFSFWAAA